MRTGSRILIPPKNCVQNGKYSIFHHCPCMKLPDLTWMKQEHPPTQHFAPTLSPPWQSAVAALWVITPLQEILVLIQITLDTNCFSKWSSGWSFLSHFPTSADHNTCLTLSFQSNILKIDLQTSLGIVLANMGPFKKSKSLVTQTQQLRNLISSFKSCEGYNFKLMASLSLMKHQLLFYFPFIFSNKALYPDTIARIIKNVMKLI